MLSYIFGKVYVPGAQKIMITEGNPQLSPISHVIKNVTRPR